MGQEAVHEMGPGATVAFQGSEVPSDVQSRPRWLTGNL